jgi:hypothetical protein
MDEWTAQQVRMEEAVCTCPPGRPHWRCGLSAHRVQARRSAKQPKEPTP